MEATYGSYLDSSTSQQMCSKHYAQLLVRQSIGSSICPQGPHNMGNPQDQPTLFRFPINSEPPPLDFPRSDLNHRFLSQECTKHSLLHQQPGFLQDGQGGSIQRQQEPEALHKNKKKDHSFKRIEMPITVSQGNLSHMKVSPSSV